MDLFNPALPGAVAHAAGFRRSGWVAWAELSDDEKAAHTDAVEAAAKADADAVQERRDAWEAAQQAAVDAAAAQAALGADAEPDELKVAELRAYAEQRGIDLGGARKKADIVAAIEAAEKDNTNQAPGAGDTTKE